MRILLTGGSGFIGRSLLEGLREHEVFAPSHSELDVTDSAAVDGLFRERRFDAVIHAALPGGETVAEGILRAHWNLARNAHRVDRTFWFGSGAEYGKHRDLVKVREEEAPRAVPRDGYGLAKLLCNELLPRDGRMVNLRLFGVYGPNERYLFKFISNTVVKAILGVPVVVRQDVVFDYLWIDDLTRIVRGLLEGGTGYACLNVTPTVPVSLSEVVRLVGLACGRPITAEFEEPGLNFEYTGDNARLLEALPGLEFTPAAEGVRKLHAHWQALARTLDVEAVRRDEYRSRCRARPDATRETLAGDRE